MKRWDVLLNALGVLLVFVIVGPLIGGLVFGVYLAASQGGADAFSVALTAALLGHLGGLLPATVTGAACVAASFWLSGRKIWLAFAVVIGAVISAAHLALFDTYPTSTPGPADFLIIGAVGAAAALICALISEGFRPRRRMRRVRPSGSA